MSTVIVLIVLVSLVASLLGFWVGSWVACFGLYFDFAWVQTWVVGLFGCGALSVIVYTWLRACVVLFCGLYSALYLWCHGIAGFALHRYCYLCIVWFRGVTFPDACEVCVYVL